MFLGFLLPIMLERNGLRNMINAYPPPPYYIQSKRTGKSDQAIRLFTPLLASTAGTGGMISSHSAAMMGKWLHNPAIQIENSAKKEEVFDKRSPSEHIANIRDVFAINMSDLASVLGVTRPTVYAWLGGQEPKGEAIVRIQQLSHVADKFSQENISRLDKLVHRPILNGRSLLDILKTGVDPIEALPIIKSVADKEARVRRESKSSGKHLRSLDDVLSESYMIIYEGS